MIKKVYLGFIMFSVMLMVACNLKATESVVLADGDGVWGDTIEFSMHQECIGTDTSTKIIRGGDSFTLVRVRGKSALKMTLQGYDQSNVRTVFQWATDPGPEKGEGRMENYLDTRYPSPTPNFFNLAVKGWLTVSGDTYFVVLGQYDYGWFHSYWVIGAPFDESSTVKGALILGNKYKITKGDNRYTFIISTYSNGNKKANI